MRKRIHLSHFAILPVPIYVDGNEHTKTDFSGTTEYIYDGLNRLKTALLPDGTKQTYTFDDNSNRTKLTVEKNGAVLEETTYTYNKNDQLLSESRQKGIEAPLLTNYFYDAVGNMVEKSGAANAEQTFDVLNRMTGYTEGTTEAAYEYQSDNMRSSKTVDGVSTEQVWVNGQIVLDKQGTDVVKYTYGSKLVHSDYGWYSYDAHGSVTMLTDDTGAVIKRYDYDPYGVELGEADEADANPFRYSGQYTDKETGYIYLRARYYDPSLGRFLSMDLMLDGANWYIYCAGNPISFVDPSGFTSEEYANYLSSYKPKMRGSFNSSMDYMEYMRQYTAQEITETPIRVRPRGSYANSAEYAQFLKDSSPEPPAISKVSPTSISERGIDFIKQAESLSNTKYYNKGENYPTIGYGHYMSDGKDYVVINGKQYTELTEELARDLLKQDIGVFENSFNNFITKNKITLSQYQYDACIADSFQKGQNVWTNGSTISQYILNGNYNDYDQALEAFLNNTKNNGLINRRTAETDMFIYGEYRTW